MCPAYSCCHRRGSGTLRTPFYYLARLALATGTAELLPNQLPALAARQLSLWAQLQHTLHGRRCVPLARIRPLAEQLLAALLLRECCRRAVRHTVALADALGPAVLLEWGAEGTVARVDWERLWHGWGPGPDEEAGRVVQARPPFQPATTSRRSSK